MANIEKAPILESTRTTYFDTSQEYRFESGKPPGSLKINEVPDLPETHDAQALETEW